MSTPMQAFDEAAARLRDDAYKSACNVYRSSLRRLLRVDDEEDEGRKALLEGVVTMLAPDLSKPL